MFCSFFRNVGMGTSTSVARLGSFASPYVVHLVREIIDRLFIFVCFFFPSKVCLITTCTIRHYRNEKGNGAEMRPAIGCGIVTGC